MALEQIGEKNEGKSGTNLQNIGRTDQEEYLGKLTLIQSIEYQRNFLWRISFKIGYEF